MSYTAQDVKDLGNLLRAAKMVKNGVQELLHLFSNLDLDTSRVGEALGNVDSARHGLNRALLLLEQEEERIKEMVDAD